MSMLTRSFLLCTLLLGCSDRTPTPAPKETGRTGSTTIMSAWGTVTMPKGWRLLTDVSEPANVYLLLACEHPDFPSLIKAKIFKDVPPARILELAEEAAQTRILQGYDVGKPQFFKNGGVFLSLTLRNADGTEKARQVMDFQPAGTTTLLVMGMWPPDKQLIGLTAFTETLNSFHE